MLALPFKEDYFSTKISLFVALAPTTTCATGYHSFFSQYKNNYKVFLKSIRVLGQHFFSVEQTLKILKKKESDFVNEFEVYYTDETALSNQFKSSFGVTSLKNLEHIF